MPRRAASQINRPLAIFATLLVVVGVISVVVVSSEFNKATTPHSLKHGETSATQTSGPYASGTIVLVNDNAVTLVRLDATSERVTSEQFTARFSGEQLPVEGSSLANSTKTYFHLPSASSTPARPSPDGSSSALLSDGKNGTMSVSVMHGDAPSQSIVLRDERGRALESASLLGWFDSHAMAVTGATTNTSAVYAVNISGSVTYLVDLPSSVVWSEARGGSVWYATGVMGEGIESAPRGPSELHRIASDGTDTLVAHDELHIYLTVIPSQSSDFAVTTDDGKSQLMRTNDGAKTLSLGKLRPLLFLPGGKLLVRDGYDISVFDPDTQITHKLVSAPEGQVSAFFLP